MSAGCTVGPIIRQCGQWIVPIMHNSRKIHPLNKNRSSSGGSSSGGGGSSSCSGSSSSLSQSGLEKT